MVRIVYGGFFKVSETKKAVISIQADSSDDLPYWVQVGLRDKTVPAFLTGAVNVIFEYVKGVIKISFEATAKSIMVIYGKVKDAMPSSIIRRQGCTVSTV